MYAHDMAAPENPKSRAWDGLWEAARNHEHACCHQRTDLRAGRSGRDALEQLPQESKQWLPPLPYKQPSQVQARNKPRNHSVY